MNPTIQAKPAMRLVRAPVSEARLGSSTTARMDTPIRVRLKSSPQRHGHDHRAADGDQLLVGEVDPEHVDLIALANHSGRLRVIVWFQMVETSP